MAKFRPCIDLHQGKVKQIVGSTLNQNPALLQTNFVSDHSAQYYAQLYAQHHLTGGHIIKLGQGNESAAQEALKAYPQGMQIGGGIHSKNAESYLQQGASAVIVTSFLFDANGHFQKSKLDAMVSAVGKENLVIDLSCRRCASGWIVAMNRWQTPTDLQITPQTLQELSNHCSEFLIHAAHVEGKQSGIDQELVGLLSKCTPIPCTYAGGARNRQDLQEFAQVSQGKLDITIGSALDIFGGTGITLQECLDFNAQE